MGTGLLGEKEKKQERMDRICKELEVLQHKISAAQAREREHEGKIQKCRGKIEGAGGKTSAGMQRGHRAGFGEAEKKRRGV